MPTQAENTSLLISVVEKRAPQFAGRVNANVMTWVEMCGCKKKKEKKKQRCGRAGAVMIDGGRRT